jgi:hypothetical protein
MKADWLNRVENWKFKQALAQIPADHPIRLDPDHDVLTALAAMFEDCGWSMGSGHMAALIEAAVDGLLARWTPLGEGAKTR